jgi:hypothetical protein
MNTVVWLERIVAESKASLQRSWLIRGKALELASVKYCIYILGQKVVLTRTMLLG